MGLAAIAPKGLSPAARRFAETIRADQRDLRPRDTIDLQSFMWVQGSDVYEE